MSNFMLERTSYYYFNLLDAGEQQLYKTFLYALLNMKPIVDIKESFNSEQISKINRYILNDRPDIFWYRGSHVITTLNKVIVNVEFNYIYSASQKDTIIRNIENSSLYKHIDTKLRSEKSDFGKALRLYELIIKNAEYEVAAIGSKGRDYEYAYSMEGIFLKHRAVCAGYAKAFQYFASKHNIWCTLVTGYAKSESHAWNLINLYGSYYYIDSTWGDPVFSKVSNKAPDYISYRHFCITTEELKRSHQPRFDDPMPLCTETKYNYYEFFGMKEHSYSVESVAKQIINAVKNSRNEVEIKYTSQSAYQTALVKLFDDSEVFEALKIAGRYVNGLAIKKIKYNHYDADKIITIKLS